MITLQMCGFRSQRTSVYNNIMRQHKTKSKLFVIWLLGGCALFTLTTFCQLTKLCSG